MLSEQDAEDLKHIAERLRDDARMALFPHPNPDVDAINSAAAAVYVRESNLILRILREAGYSGIGSDWKIENRRVIHVD